MDELDMLLSVIENPTRRRILEALVREPHYPLQLSKELGLSQQGIMKHLRMLEELDLVRSFLEDSDQGGPSRRRYFPTTGFTMVVDIGPGLFNTEVASRPFENRGAEKQERDGRRLLDLRKDLGEIDQELVRLRERRAELIAEKESILEEAGRAVESSPMDYRSRKIVYEYILHPQMSAKDLARGLGLRDDSVENIINMLEEENDAKRT
ncbi:MAG TPA: helix-turn-helix domain-containing protein [Methanomassiliicoccales archaeon]|nr:helix-turn-helix domain-containing protein [Methanomassiliicoccales archaeon]